MIGLAGLVGPVARRRRRAGAARPRRRSRSSPRWPTPAGPFPYGYRGLGEVFVFLFFGLVAVVGHGVPPGAAGSSRSSSSRRSRSGALMTAILVVNNLRDIPTDTAAGKRTLAVAARPPADGAGVRAPAGGCARGPGAPGRARARGRRRPAGAGPGPAAAHPAAGDAAAADGPRLRATPRELNAVAQGDGPAGARLRGRCSRSAWPSSGSPGEAGMSDPASAHPGERPRCARSSRRCRWRPVGAPRARPVPAPVRHGDRDVAPSRGVDRAARGGRRTDRPGRGGPGARRDRGRGDDPGPRDPRGRRAAPATGDLPDAEELELLGGPGRALRAALDARAAGPGARPPDGARGAGQRDDRLRGAARGRRGGPAGDRGRLHDAQAQGRRRARDRGPRRPRAGHPAGRRPGRPAAARRQRGLGPRRRPRSGSTPSPASTSSTWSSRWPADDAAGAGRAAPPGRASRSRPTRRSTRRAPPRSLLAAGAVDVLVVKPARVGGPVAVAEIAARPRRCGTSRS